MTNIWRDRLFGAVCLALPFLFIPKIFWQSFIGGPLGSMLLVYPILSLYGYTAYQWKRGKFSFCNVKSFCSFIAIYVVILIVSLLWGLYNYPYYDLIFNGPAGQIEKLEKVMGLFHSNGIWVDEKIVLALWVVARLLKRIFFECFYMFFCSYLIYCWYRQNPLKASTIFEKAIQYITVIVTGYAAIEIAYFCGETWAKSILVTVNPMLHTIAENWDWWPPLLWGELRVRSIFPEPSQFGMYAAVIVPFFWTGILYKKKIIRNGLFSVIIMTLIFLSSSKTASYLLLGEAIALGVFVLYIRHCDLLRRYLSVLLCMGVAFVLSAGCVYFYSYSDDKQEFLQSSSRSIKTSFTEVVNENAGSNAARFSIIKSDLRIWKDHPGLGVGAGLKAAYVPEYLTEKERAVPEVKMWMEKQEKKGVLKSPIGSVCEYSNRLAETGLLGLTIYLFSVLLLCALIVKKRKCFIHDREIQMGILPILIAIAGVMVSGVSGMMTTFHTLWILLGIAFAYVLKEG